VGRYHDASLANMKAIEVDRAFIKQTGETGVYPTMYYSHNLQFLCYSLMMEGRGKEAARPLHQDVGLRRRDPFILNRAPTCQASPTPRVRRRRLGKVLRPAVRASIDCPGRYWQIRTAD
jgi:hypothetical protein